MSKAAASKSKAKTKSTVSRQYESALLGAPEVTETRTKTTSRAIAAPSKPVTNGAAPQAPSTRLTTPKTLPKNSAVPAGSKVKVATTTCTTETHTPVTGQGVMERLQSLGYEYVLGFTSGGHLEAVYAISPLGEKVLIRTRSRPAQKNDAKNTTVEGADDSVIEEDVYGYFLQELITDANLGARIDTDFAILTPDGLSVWVDDGNAAAHWLYSDPAAVAAATKLQEGWFVLASVELDALKEPSVRGNTIVDRLFEPPEDRETGESVATFGTLIQLLRMTGLMEVLKSSGPYTLLAPTDEAFARLPEATARDLVKFSSRNKLASILEYHVYADKESARDIGDEPTVQGELVAFDKTSNPIMANKARVLYVDLEAQNGVIHIIDRVLIPQNPGSGALTALLEPTDSDDIDYTTQRIRQLLSTYNKNTNVNIADAKSKLDSALANLAAAKSGTAAVSRDALSKTKRYNTISENKSRTKEAIKLAEDISIENDVVDANLMRQNEIQDVLGQLDLLTAQIAALAGKLKQNNAAAANGGSGGAQ